MKNDLRLNIVRDLSGDEVRSCNVTSKARFETGLIQKHVGLSDISDMKRNN